MRGDVFLRLAHATIQLPISVLEPALKTAPLYQLLLINNGLGRLLGSPWNTTSAEELY